jgi:hypothetical protein
MAIEVDAQCYLFKQFPEVGDTTQPSSSSSTHPKSKLREIILAHKRGEDTPIAYEPFKMTVQKVEAEAFRYNFLHELESVLWIAFDSVSNNEVCEVRVSEDAMTTATLNPPSGDLVGSSNVTCPRSESLSAEYALEYLSKSKATITTWHRRTEEQVKYAQSLFSSFEARRRAISFPESNPLEEQLFSYPPYLSGICTELINLRRELCRCYIKIERPGFNPSDFAEVCEPLYELFATAFARISKSLRDAHKDLFLAPLGCDPRPPQLDKEKHHAIEEYIVTLEKPAAIPKRERKLKEPSNTKKRRVSN